MAYKTIVVQFEREPDLHGPLLKTAAALAHAHGAHLIGISVLPSYYKVPPDAAGAMVPMDEVHEKCRAAGLRMKAVFEADLQHRAITCEWRTIDPGFRDMAQAVADIANAADLVIAGQQIHGDFDSGYRDGQGQLPVLTGRPVLLLPLDHSAPTPPGRIIVAWDGSQSSTRALFDALPLMKPPAHVTLLSMRAAETFDGPAFLAQNDHGNDVAAMLSRHGISCTVAVEIASGNDIGPTILSYATARQADLLVIGAYGHSRLTEWFFGGVTRTLLRQSAIPLLLSH